MSYISPISNSQMIRDTKAVPTDPLSVVDPSSSGKSVSAGIIAGIIGLVGTLLSAGTTIGSNLANRKAVDRQNAYNTPKQQLSRLKDAGLNPYLMYANGANTGLQTNYAEQQPVTGIGEMLSGAVTSSSNYQNAQTNESLSKSQVALNQAATVNTLFQTSRGRQLLPLEKAESLARQALVNSQTAGQEISNTYMPGVYHSQIQNAMADLGLKQYELEHIKPQQLANMIQEKNESISREMLNKAKTAEAYQAIKESKQRIKESQERIDAMWLTSSVDAATKVANTQMEWKKTNQMIDNAIATEQLTREEAYRLHQMNDHLLLYTVAGATVGGAATVGAAALK